MADTKNKMADTKSKVPTELNFDDIKGEINFKGFSDTQRNTIPPFEDVKDQIQFTNFTNF